MGNSFSCESCSKQRNIKETVELSCNHKCCKACVASTARRGIESKNLEILKCPSNAQCYAPITKSVLENVLGPETLRQYEGLVESAVQNENLLSNSPPCPKCNNPAVAEQDRFYGHCADCEYIFCTKCRTDYHGFNCDAKKEMDVDAGISEKLRVILRLVKELSNSDSDEDSDNDFETAEDNDNELCEGSATFECCICLSDKRLTLAIDFGCGHQSCCEQCVQTFFATLIKDGNVHELRCPESGCKTEATPGLVKQMVDETVFTRYDKLLLEEVLGDFPEIVNCPKPNCQRRVTAEPEYGYCEHCDFRFCTECNQPFHGLAGCGQTEEERKAELKRYLAADQKEREKIEKEAVGLRKQQNMDSENLIKRLFKKCPFCKASIEKIAGCNHMQCTKCRTHFCWVCGERIVTADPYLHFNKPGSKCVTIEVPPE